MTAAEVTAGQAVTMGAGKGVTARGGRGSRNARVKAQVVSVPVCDCGARIAHYQPLDAGGDPVGRAKPIGRHCTACHSSGHAACAGCGKCLPRLASPGRFGRSAEFGRVDRCYCTSACRQRSYRRRVASREESA